MNHKKQAPRPRKPPSRLGIWIVEGGKTLRIVAIEYQDGWPVNVLTEEHWDHRNKPWFRPGRSQPTGICPQYWDFNYSKASETLYYHNSGSGGEVRYIVSRFVHPDPPPAHLWVADGIPIVRTVRARGTERGWTERRVGDRELLRLGYRRLRHPRRLPERYGNLRTTNPFAVGEEGETVWCEQCEDHQPTDGSYSPCEHISWCHQCSLLVYDDTRNYVGEPGQCDCLDEDEETE